MKGDAAPDQLAADRHQIVVDLLPSALTQRERVVEELMAGFEQVLAEFPKIEHEAFGAQRFSLERHLKLPGVAVKVHAKARVSAQMVRKADIDASDDAVHDSPAVSRLGFGVSTQDHDLRTFPAQAIRRLIDQGAIRSCHALKAEQLQPASLDLSLSEEAYQVPGSLLPLRGEQTRDLVRRFAYRSLDLSQPEVLVRGNVYVVRLNESLQLPPGVSGYTNSKSSIGRIDLQTRGLSDQNPRYDRIQAGYAGELWLELSPKSFDVCVRAGDSLNQIIFFGRRAQLSTEAIRRQNQKRPFLYAPDQSPIPLEGGGEDPGLLMTLDLQQEVVGYVAKKSYRPIDLAKVGGHDAADYFEPIARPKDAALFLSKTSFYIFSTYEYVSLPPELAVEMLPYDMSAGEFRAHYAGFFDPGFGFGAAGELLGTPAVLEVRPYEDDLIVRHRQPVCKMAPEWLSEVPELLYGVGLSSHYAAQRGPRLSKYFR